MSSFSVMCTLLINSMTSLSMCSLPSFFEKVKYCYACSLFVSTSSYIEEPGGLMALCAWSLLYSVFCEG